MALGKAQGVTPLEAETAVNKFWVNNYTTLVDEIKARLGEDEGECRNEGGERHNRKSAKRADTFSLHHVFHSSDN